MKNSQIIIAAIVTYLIIAVAGGTVYYVLEQQPPAERQEVDPQAAERAARAAAKQAEQEKEAAILAEQRKQREAREREREQQKQALTRDMRQQTVNGVTHYSYPQVSHPASGIYLYPSLAVGELCRLSIDVLYYYDIHDSLGTAWIYGDHLGIEADGRTFDLAFDPARRQKMVASDAEWLWERYMKHADKQTVEALRQAGSSSYVTLTYYKQGGKSRSRQLSAEEIKHLHDIVALYDVFQAEAKEQSGT